jgi:16S rRNA (adenine1518-N6/adenine1519-N6)-dimethyltransferase
VQVVKAGFNQRRKTLRNALKALNKNLENISERFLQSRAEQLSADEFIEITKVLENEQ